MFYILATVKLLSFTPAFATMKNPIGAFHHRTSQVQYQTCRINHPRQLCGFLNALKDLLFKISLSSYVYQASYILYLLYLFDSTYCIYYHLLITRLHLEQGFSWIPRNLGKCRKLSSFLERRREDVTEDSQSVLLEGSIESSKSDSQFTSEQIK